MVDVLVIVETLLNYFITIFGNFFNFLFSEFYIFPPPIDITLGDLLLSSLILSVLFKLFISVPNTNKKGGGKRAKGSKKSSSSSSSDSSDS